MEGAPSAEHWVDGIAQTSTKKIVCDACDAVLVQC